MSLWKQILTTLALAAVVAVIWALYVPAAQPVLERLGVLEPMTRIGILKPLEEGTRGGAQGGMAGTGGEGVRVTASPPVPRALGDIVTAVGSAQSQRAVTLASEVSGRVTAVHVASGARVQAGEPLVEIDDDAARIAVQRATLTLQDARTDLTRIQRLRDTGAGTELALQQAQLAVATAELEVRQSEYDLSLHRIRAPLEGWAGILELEPGDRVSEGDEVTRIEDRRRLLVDFRVPERAVAQIGIGDAVSVASLADPTRAIAGRITALDNRLDAASRTLRVQAEIENADDRLRPGMALKIELHFTGEPHPAVAPLAIQWGNSGAFVWIVRDGRARTLPVRILQRDPSAVLVSADFLPGDMVVEEGVQSLRAGGAVTLAGSGG